MSARLEAIRQQLNDSVREHDPRFDSFLYNGGTVLALLATLLATAALWPADFAWVPRALSGLAAFLIAVERGLNFGARWAFHKKYQSGYKQFLLRLEVAENTKDEAERDRKIDALLDDIEVYRKLESDIPRGGRRISGMIRISRSAL
jgi:hypothetical protein